MNDLDTAVWRTVHSGKDSVERIAEATGINRNTLYRYGLPIGANGLDIPLTKLIPIMRAAKRFDILKVVASQCGWLLVRVPRVPRSRRDQDVIVSGFQKVCAMVGQRLIEFFDRPSREAQKQACDGLMACVAEAIGIEKRIRNFYQLELELD